MSDIKIWTVEEMVHKDEFTDRVELLRELDQRVAAIQRMGAPSTEHGPALRLRCAKGVRQTRQTKRLRNT